LGDRAPTAERCELSRLLAEERQMFHPYETSEGTIEGLYLPLLAWDVFHRENIRTSDQLRAVVGQLEQFDGIGPITARVIRQELDRVAAPGEQLSGDGQLSVWGS
jgi:hypothetical protein